MNMKEKSSYIKGLLEGLAIDETKPEGKIIAALVEAVDELSAEVEKLKTDMEDYGEYVEELDEDLGMVEEVVYDLDDEDEDDECDFDCDNCDDEDCELRDGDFYCAVCPKCGEKIYFDESADPSEIVCPSCKTPLEPEEEEEEKED